MFTDSFPSNETSLVIRLYFMLSQSYALDFFQLVFKFLSHVAWRDPFVWVGKDQLDIADLHNK